MGAQSLNMGGSVWMRQGWGSEGRAIVIWAAGGGRSFSPEGEGEVSRLDFPASIVVGMGKLRAAVT